jgi:hypothetical protein
MELIRGGVITAGFDDPRPLTQPGLHIHGALDISGGDRLVRAPVGGTARGYLINRGASWITGDKPEVLQLPFREYFSDTFGAIIVIVERETGRMHILAHFWPTNILNGNIAQTTPFHFESYTESSKMDRNPAFIIATQQIEINPGDILGPIGSAGFSTGAHVHWEIHHGWKIDDYKDRIRPTEYLQGQSG